MSKVIEDEMKKVVEEINDGNYHVDEDVIEEEDEDEDQFLKQYNEVIDEALNCLSNKTTGCQDRRLEAEVIEKLVKSKIAYMQFEADKRDKEERRRIDEERNKINAKIEAEKAKKPVSDKLWDIGGKIALGLMNCGFSMVMLRVILEFEENGSLRSKPGREFKIFKNWF